MKIVGTAKAYIFDGQNQAYITFYVTQRASKQIYSTPKYSLVKKNGNISAVDPLKILSIADNDNNFRKKMKTITLTLKLNLKKLLYIIHM